MDHYDLTLLEGDQVAVAGCALMLVACCLESSSCRKELSLVQRSNMFPYQGLEAILLFASPVVQLLLLHACALAMAACMLSNRPPQLTLNV